MNERYGNVTTTGEIRILGRNIYDPDVSLASCARRSAWCSSAPTRCRSRSTRTSCSGCACTHAGDAHRRGQLDELVESALTEVQLWDDVKDRLHQKATRLTLEQQQKLCIARLLPLKPRVILMDEPCSALDAEGTAAIER